MEETVESDLTHQALIHDLNNVFETITEAAELLSSDRRWKSLAATLCRSVNRGKRLLGFIPDRTPNLAGTVEDAIQSVTDYCTAARKPRLRFVRQIPPDIRLPGSDKDWERVFINLFLNAAQIMQKPGRIDIVAQQTEPGLSITISDNGPGIPADILPRMFRPNVSLWPVGAWASHRCVYRETAFRGRNGDEPGAGQWRRVHNSAAPNLMFKDPRSEQFLSWRLFIPIHKDPLTTCPG
jgi:nitrogen-specific signal transduction histidine kinase